MPDDVQFGIEMTPPLFAARVIASRVCDVLICPEGVAKDTVSPLLAPLAQRILADGKIDVEKSTVEKLAIEWEASHYEKTRGERWSQPFGLALAAAFILYSRTAVNIPRVNNGGLRMLYDDIRNAIRDGAKFDPELAEAIATIGSAVSVPEYQQSFCRAMVHLLSVEASLATHRELVQTLTETMQPSVSTEPSLLRDLLQIAGTTRDFEWILEKSKNLTRQIEEDCCAFANHLK